MAKLRELATTTSQTLPKPDVWWSHWDLIKPEIVVIWQPETKKWKVWHVIGELKSTGKAVSVGVPFKFLHEKNWRDDIRRAASGDPDFNKRKLRMWTNGKTLLRENQLKHMKDA